MANKKNICRDCKYFNFEICENKNRREIVIKDRREQMVLYKPNKETKCDYYEEF